MSMTAPPTTTGLAPPLPPCATADIDSWRREGAKVENNVRWKPGVAVADVEAGALDARSLDASEHAIWDPT